MKLQIEAVAQTQRLELVFAQFTRQAPLDLAAAAALVAQLGKLAGAFLSARADSARLGTLIDEGIGLYQQTADILGGIGAYAAMAASTALTDVI